MVDLVRGVRAADVRANLERVRERIDAAGRTGAVEILAAVKYLPAQELPALADGGVTLVGENRAQELVAKAATVPGRFTWDFIGGLQSRKVAQLVPHVRYIHSVATESALVQLARHGRAGGNGIRILIEVNVAREAGKAGIAPAELSGFIERSAVPVVGLMTMPPQTARPEDSRRHFAALRELAERHALRELSMGTSQDYGVAVEEGATIIRLGMRLFGPSAP